MAKGVTIVIQGDGESAKRALEMVQTNLHETGDKAEHEASRISESMERVKYALETIGLYMGIREGIDALKELVGGSVELGVELGHLNQQTGISTENLSVLHYMAEKTGVGFETLTKSFKKFSTNISEVESGGQKATAAFARIGISAADVKKAGGDIYAVMGMVADRFENLPNGADKAASSIGLFGKAGMSMIPTLNEGTEGIARFKDEAQSMGLVLGSENVEKLEQLHQSLQKLKGIAVAAGLSFTEGLSPALSELFDIISSGKTDQSLLEQFGDVLGRVMAYAADQAYQLGAGVEYVFGGIEKLVSMASTGDIARSALEASQKDFAKAEELAKKAGALEDLAYNGAKKKERKPERGGTDAEFGEPVGKEKKEHSDDSIVRAAAGLLEEQAKAVADLQKNVSQAQIAELESQHKIMLIGDQEFYQEKLRLQVEAFNAEQAALASRAATLEALYAKQRDDKLLKRDKQGNSAEELRTMRELVQVTEQLQAVQARSQAAASANAAEVNAGNQASLLAGLKMAAELEGLRNDSITARLALLAHENELEAKKIVNAGGTQEDAANVRALGEMEAQKLRIGQVTRQITLTEQDYKRAVDELNDAAAKDPRLKDAAQKQINALNQQEAAQLRDLVVAYDELAATLGGDFIEKARDLHAELDKLNRPNQRDQAQFYKTLGTGLDSITNKLVENAALGTESWHNMIRSIEKETLELALKLAEQQFISPLLTGAGKAGLPQVSAGQGGLAAAASLAGAGAPSLAGSSFFSGLAGKLLGGASGAARGNGSPNVTIQITNQSSQAVTMEQSGSSFDQEGEQFIISTILKNADQGGVLRGVFGG